MKGQIFEERVARFMKGKHKGGPGEPDYTRGAIDGEVKDWKIRMGKSNLQAEADKGRDEIVSRQGFTDEALNYRDRYRSKIKLFDWNKKKFM